MVDVVVSDMGQRGGPVFENRDIRAMVESLQPVRRQFSERWRIRVAGASSFRDVSQTLQERLVLPGGRSILGSDCGGLISTNEVYRLRGPARSTEATRYRSDEVAIWICLAKEFIRLVPVLGLIGAPFG